jgi:hypothetical protein
LPAHAVLAALGAKRTLMAEIDQGIEIFVGFQPNAAAIAAIAAIGAAERDEFFASKTDAAVAAIPGEHLDFGFVDEFHDAIVSAICEVGENHGISGARGFAQVCARFSPAETKSPAVAGLFDV